MLSQKVLHAISKGLMNPQYSSKWPQNTPNLPRNSLGSFLKRTILDDSKTFLEPISGYFSSPGDVFRVTLRISWTRKPRKALPQHPGKSSAHPGSSMSPYGLIEVEKCPKTCQIGHLSVFKSTERDIPRPFYGKISLLSPGQPSHNIQGGLPPTQDQV